MRRLLARHLYDQLPVSLSALEARSRQHGSPAPHPEMRPVIDPLSTARRASAALWADENTTFKPVSRPAQARNRLHRFAVDIELGCRARRPIPFRRCSARCGCVLRRPLLDTTS